MRTHQLEDVSSLRFDPDTGLYFAPRRKIATISFPKDGHQDCLSVEEQSFWFQHRNRCIQALLMSNPFIGTMLDVGGGNGSVALAMQQAGHDVVLVEPIEEGCLNALARGIHKVVHCDLESAGFAEQALDAVGYFDVLEHLEDDEAQLCLAKRLLRPGGMLYVTVPAYNRLWSAADEEAGHFRRYSLQTLTELIQRSGFDVHYAGCFFMALLPPLYLARSFPSMLGHKRSVKSLSNDHVLPPWLQKAVTRLLLDFERRAIKSKIRLPFGTSIILAASSRSPHAHEHR